MFLLNGVKKSVDKLKCREIYRFLISTIKKNNPQLLKNGLRYVILVNMNRKPSLVGHLKYVLKQISRLFNTKL